MSDREESPGFSHGEYVKAHAAAIEAGFRQRPVYMPLDPPALAKAIKKHLSPEDIETLCALLHA